jgi:hypothetical protein
MFEKGQAFDIIAFDESDKETFEQARKKIHDAGNNILSLGFQVVRGKEENRIYVFVVYKG